MTPDRLTSLDALESLADELNKPVVQNGDWFYVLDDRGSLPVVHFAAAESVAS